VQELLPALALGEVEVGEEDERALGRAEVPRIDAHGIEGFEVERAAEDAHPLLGDAASGERVDVEPRGDPQLVAVHERTDPALGGAVGLEHHARHVDGVGQAGLAVTRQVLVDGHDRSGGPAPLLALDLLDLGRGQAGGRVGPAHLVHGGLVAVRLEHPQEATELVGVTGRVHDGSDPQLRRGRERGIAEDRGRVPVEGCGGGSHFKSYRRLCEVL
jgi:hypothetical protein